MPVIVVPSEILVNGDEQWRKPKQPRHFLVLKSRPNENWKFQLPLDHGRILIIISLWIN